MAIAIPPSVMVLMVIPSAFSANTATTSESGIASTDMKVVRPLQRKRKRMMTTRSAPSRSASITLSTAVRMKSACRNTPRLIAMPSGKVAWISVSVSSMRRVNSSVLVCGCF